MRVLKWIIDRCEASPEAGALKSPIGWLPGPHHLDLTGLNIDRKQLALLLAIDHEEWKKEIAAHQRFFYSLGGVVPEELQRQRRQLALRFAE
ncbi:MAG: phosphoenolpyruvate carboxykinase (GTP), partial [Chthoniobacterales bacterium]|nr:phosphoenolpyruvate carboxykinase (GTP) [Chthoniobacterales bacterium]